ncbi:MAG: sensor histidine kinase [Pseudomonadales bacterium]|nr:sensor histidine kinase [Pseudomonadales bacterium]
MRTQLLASAAGRKKQGPGLRGLAVNGVVCLGIATMIQILIEDAYFLGNLFLSCCIGYSIYGTIWLAFYLFSPRLPAALLIAAGMATGLFLGLAIAGTVLFTDPLYFVSEDYEVLVLGVLFGVLATLGFVLLGDLWDVRARLREVEREGLERDKAMAESELRVLQAQIEPHFLFNTLANVISLIDDDPKRARSLLERLTSLLRTSLARTRAEAVTIADEIAVLRDYLEIQALRMEGRLAYAIDVAPELEGHPIPPLLVQPLVENAVLHGIEPRAEGGRVEVSVRPEQDGVVITIDDDGIGFGSEETPSGTGLANVRERLRALYGDRARLALTVPEHGGLRAELHLPTGASA